MVDVVMVVTDNDELFSRESKINTEKVIAL